MIGLLMEMMQWNAEYLLARKQHERHLRYECPDDPEEALASCQFCAHDLREIGYLMGEDGLPEECPDDCLGCLWELEDDNDGWSAEVG
jgi:hypothetical protein